MAIRPPSFTESLRLATLAFVTSRLLVVAAGWAALGWWGIDASEFEVNWRPFSSSWTIVDAALRYDAQWYLTIARDGYGGIIEGPYFDMRPNFMPLFPAVVAALGRVGVPFVAAGLFVASGASIVGLACLHQIVARDFDRRIADTTPWVVALFPSSLFLSSAYSEGPLMAASMGAWLAAQHGRFLLAGGLAAAATLTRPLGIIVVAPLLVMVWQTRFAWRERATAALRLLGVPTIAAAIYLAWARQTWGSALMITTTQAMYRGDTTWPWRAFARWWAEGPSLHGYANSSIDLLLAGAALASIVWLMRRAPVEYAVFAALGTVAPLTGGLISYSRMLLAVPVLACVVAATLADRPFQLPSRLSTRTLTHVVWWLATLVLSAFFSARFASWRWVA